jgi:predicted Ser/Thr protein kinase
LRDDSSGKGKGSGRAPTANGELAEGSGRLPNGATLGRYVVTGCVGAGGMGVVYSARDPDLDRRVALKVLRQELSVEQGSRARLLREARAMAQLSHPNVVPIYDVGMLGDQVFIAMELIDGATLRTKFNRTTPWRTVVNTYLQAARGLAAAHAAGLVHRDFKPDNVLFGSDGRIRVVDFGLVSVDSFEPTQRTSPEILRSGLGPLVQTTAGVVLGTPAYMAPEAIRGELTDARADQFSFCVALFHGLYGIYPFGGATLAERAEHIERGAIARPAGTQVPERVYRVLMRGLAAQPRERYRSMEALANALEHAIAPRHRTRTIALAAMGAVVVGTLVAFMLTRGGKRTVPLLQIGQVETIASTEDRQLAVTMLHDGRYVRVEHGVVTVLAADGSNSHVLATPPGLIPTKVRASSVGGSAEVYSSGAPCSWWLVPVDGGAWRPLLEDPSCASQVDLSPDGTQLAIMHKGELRVRNLVTRIDRTLFRKDYGVTSGDGVPTWSPDGKRIVLVGEISIIDVASGTNSHHGRIGVAACWLDANRVAYITRTWLHSEIRLLDVRTDSDELAVEMEGAIGELVASNGGVLVRRDELHSRAYLAPAASATSTSIEGLPQLDTGSAVDFQPFTWAPDGGVVTMAMVAGQRGLVRTVPGQRGAPLVLHRTRNIMSLSSTHGQILYSLNDGDDCETRVFDLATRKDKFWRTSRCAQRPYMTCGQSSSRCLVIDDAGTRWFDPSTMQYDGPAPHFELDEKLSPDATASVRLRGAAVVIRNLASGTETTIAAPPNDGPLDIGWGNDSNMLVAMSFTPGHQRMLIRAHDGQWRTIIEDPHRNLNGYAVSPDGSQVAIVALLSASTWSYLPFASTAKK